MRYSNFRELVKSPDTAHNFAVVDQHCWLPFVKPRQVKIFSTTGGSWRSMETGQYMPDAVDRLEMAFKARKQLAQIYADKP